MKPKNIQCIIILIKKINLLQCKRFISLGGNSHPTVHHKSCFQTYQGGSTRRLKGGAPRLLKYLYRITGHSYVFEDTPLHEQTLTSRGVKHFTLDILRDTRFVKHVRHPVDADRKSSLNVQTPKLLYLTRGAGGVRL